MLFTVIFHTGGLASPYYVGLVLLIIGTGVLAPLSVKQGIIAIGGLVATYLVLGIGYAEDEQLQQAWLSVFFLVAASFCGVMSCAYLDRLRFADFVQRREIEAARDELAELDQAKSRFTANIHHELRTPLTLTLAPVEAMLAGEFGNVSELQRSYLQTVQNNGLRLLKLINNLLDLAKAEGGQLEVHRQSLAIGSVVEQIVAGALPLAERKGVRLETRGLAELPTVCADREAIEKVVVNLLGNALKFTDRGGSVVVEGHAEEAGVCLVVRDSGVGIPADQLERIFDRFAQVDASSTRQFEGTGIGLSLVSELVSLHEGRVWAESPGEGQGASMHVWLPFGQSDGAADEGEEVLLGDGSQPDGSLERALAGFGAEIEDGESRESEWERSGQLSELAHSVERSEWSQRGGEAGGENLASHASEVLVVDDNADLRRLLADLLGAEFRVRTARNGREGLEAVRESSPDCVLTDVMMPEMSGTELCAAIKADASLRAVPVVLVTSKAEREMKIEGLELGADDYVTKPFHPRELLARVRSLVALRRAQQELEERNRLLSETNEELEQTMAELKRAGAQLVHAERLAAVGELAAGVAHEINNPVNFAVNAARALQTTVQGALERRRELSEDAETLQELSSIVTEGLERTAALVGDLREFAAAGPRERRAVDVVRGLRTTLRLIGHSLVQAGVQVHTDLPEGLPRLEADPRALNQVFLNLLKNAAEAFEGRAGSIWVSARREGDFVAVEIRDDGPGIAPAVREHLFDPFVTSKEGSGSGLGLAITKRIVEEHGGRIELESQPGQGSRFVLHFPTGSMGPTGPTGQGEAPRAA